MSNTVHFVCVYVCLCEWELTKVSFHISFLSQVSHPPPPQGHIDTGSQIAY